MTRARIAALVLVNWKGVFYERYLLDRHVTALEGANGAGKTTVMIAAYVALLPDLSKLRFTNLGETAATGGDRGIWGRLGEPGRPSYTVLELDVGGERVLAGIKLVRLAEPTVEPTAFAVTGLPADARLSELLLERRLDGDHIPELDEIKAAAARLGGTLETFRSVKEYFAFLFERGITPMRLATDEERGKLNEMLRTSMTGGISRALTSELRGFLLKEETGLAETLARMRANLEACARTRTEVAESRQLEREISAIYEAGTDMFAAAVHGTRAAAAEAEREAETARHALVEATRTQLDHADAITSREARGAEVATRLGRARVELATALADRDRALAAQAVAKRVGALETELAALAESERLARAIHGSATAERVAARAERTRALDAYDRAAHGLADLQAGLDELVRRAHGYRQLARRLADARAATGRADLEPEDAAAAITELDAERARLETERARLQRDARDLAARRSEHAAALAALTALTSSPASSLAAEPHDGADLHAHARAVLGALAGREAQASRGAELERELREAEVLAARQVAAHALAASLAISDERAVEPRASQVIAALAAVELDLHAKQSAIEARRADATTERARAGELQSRLATLEARTAEYHLARATAARLEPTGPVPDTHAELVALRERLALEHYTLAQTRIQLEASRAELQQRAVSVERSGTNLDPELLRLRDELGGELLASRFEDLDLEAASWVEARLGPLASALIVDDLDVAAAAVERSDRSAPTVWLVQAGSPLSFEPPANAAELGDDVVSSEPFGLRITRRLPRPSLGRRARERQVRELYEAIERAASTLDETAARTALVTTWRRDVDVLEAHFGALAQGDPTAERADVEAALVALDDAAVARDTDARDDDGALALLRARLDGLRRLLPDVALLDGPDLAARAAGLALARAELSTIAADLGLVAGPRAALTQHLEALRHAPPDDATSAVDAARAGDIVARLDALATARTALEDVLVHRHAAAYSDAEIALGARVGLAPALEAQHALARAAVQRATDAEAATEATWETATAAAQLAEAQRLGALTHRDRAVAELAALGAVPAPASQALLEALERTVAELDAESRLVATDRALAVERHARATAAVEVSQARAAFAAASAGPTVAGWTDLRALAAADGLLHAVLAAGRTDRTSIQLAADAWSKKELLLDRLVRARGGDELATLLRDHALDGAGYLASWRATREWLRRRVPAQVAEIDEPLLALERLRDHLDVLEGRLARQELDLRGASEDVARGIDVQVRRAHGQVRRLNEQLTGIRFGSIHGIRVEIRRVERMEQILRALRLGEVQELLFMTAVPIEQALDEIFRRYGGGGRGGGQRLLDYREYLELGVEIRRQTSGDWEAASPTKLSTGEAIGVGAALMMVVLTEWERDANLLRGRRTGGSLRFLFLDEANRLSRDNLGVLFDLCKHLDLQLLIAAPEVARAEGNTTYRLVRHVADDGREEVLVSGRRAVASPDHPSS